MTHAERKARWHAMTVARNRNAVSVEEQLKRLGYQGLPQETLPTLPMPWDERPDTDD
jgi:hypothetical protein